MIHDCIYQFLRLFFHSRFKPQQLEMTLTQLSAPVLDLVLVLPLILRLYKDLSRFFNVKKLKIQSKSEINAFCRLVIFTTDLEDLRAKFLLFSQIYLPSIPFTDGKIRLAILYQAKTYRKTLASEMKARNAKCNLCDLFFIVFNI